MLADDLERLVDACDQLGKALVSLAEDCGKLLEVFTDAFRNAAGTVCALIPDLISTVSDNLEEKTKPPRNPVRRLGCRPQTMICHRREFRVQRR